jgi:hypothetical protein
MVHTVLLVTVMMVCRAVSTALSTAHPRSTLAVPPFE